MPLVLGVFELPDQVVQIATKLRARGFGELETYSPAPFAEVDDAVIPKPSRVRLWTLIGGLLGVTAGYTMTVWMANDWPIMLGGKPFSSIPPYTIIGFELTILIGGLLTVLGLFVVGRLPALKFDRAYSPRFSGEEFGVSVRCRERDVAEIDALMREHGAREVTLVEP